MPPVHPSLLCSHCHILGSVPPGQLLGIIEGQPAELVSDTQGDLLVLHQGLPHCQQPKFTASLLSG